VRNKISFQYLIFTQPEQKLAYTLDDRRTGISSQQEKEAFSLLHSTQSKLYSLSRLLLNGYQGPLSSR
jgi:hypothetical protein